MGEASFYKTVCTSCNGHVEYPEESDGATVACPHCGKDLFLYRSARAVGPKPGNLAEVSPNPTASMTAVWNPASAARWSFWIFSVAFGAFIHAKNAANMGRVKEAKANWVWFGIALVYLTAILTCCFVFPRFTVLDAFPLPGVALFIAWYFHVGRKQVNHAKQTLGNNFKWKSLNLPVLISLGLWIGFLGLGIFTLMARHSIAQSGANEAAPVPQASTSPLAPQDEWNTTEIDASKNGNIAVAVKWLDRNRPGSESAISPQPELVSKNPSEYYGKLVRLSGDVVMTKYYPAGTLKSVGGKEAVDIMILCDDKTVVESLCLKIKGPLVDGATVNLYGCPVGKLNADSRLDSNPPRLILVGNDYDNLGIKQ